MWNKRDIVDLAEQTIRAWNQMVESVAKATNMSRFEAETKLKAVADTKEHWRVREMPELKELQKELVKEDLKPKLRLVVGDG